MSASVCSDDVFMDMALSSNMAMSILTRSFNARHVQGIACRPACKTTPSQTKKTHAIHFSIEPDNKNIMLTEVFELQFV